MERDKALDMALSQIEKQFGKGAVMRMDEQAKMKIASIPTGALSLDLALGIGGLPRGRVVEIYGPESSGKTTVALHAIAEAQKAGGIAAFIDAEHALDPSYASALGVDIEALLVSQPDNGEQALEIADMLIRSNAIDILVVDSVAALTPRAEIEGEMGDTHVGLQARLMSQALRKLAGTLNRSRTCAVFVNQIREKVGVMFGCFTADTKVTLADGTQEEIGAIVEQRMPVEVLSYDPEAGAVVPRSVTNWFDNGPTEDFLAFTVAREGGSAQFSCTPNHQIRTPGGWREAQELAVGDRVLQAVSHHLSDFQQEVLLGAVMGGGELSPASSGHGAHLRWREDPPHVAYEEWKASLFANLGLSSGTHLQGGVHFPLSSMPELAGLREAVVIGDRTVLSHDYLKRLTPLSLAIWYMDRASLALGADGGQEWVDIGVEALEATSRARLAEHLRDVWGITSRLTAHAGEATLRFDHEGTEKLHALIAPCVHPSMAHMLPPRYRGRFRVEPVFAEQRYDLLPTPVTSIERRPRPDSAHRYDLEVEGTHNYFVDGVMVHNSPETQPGGRALKFYSSVRLDVRRIESLKDGTDFVGNRVRVKVVKNKCVAAGTRVFDPSTGVTHPIEDIVDRGAGGSVWAADKRGELHVRAVGARLDQGQQEVIGLRLRDGTELRVTPGHLVLTENGWRAAGDLAVGDRVARPRRAGAFGDREPVPADHARMLGYFIGERDLDGRTPVALRNAEPAMREDVARIAAGLGRAVEAPREPLAPGRRVPEAFFSGDVAADVVANLLFGIWESSGWIDARKTHGVRCGFATTSEQLAWQIHWLLLRWGVTTAVQQQEPTSRQKPGSRSEVTEPCWQVRVSGIDNIRRFADALPMWGPKGRALTEQLARPESRRHHRGARPAYLSAAWTAPVHAYLEQQGVTAGLVARLVGVPADRAQSGIGAVLGVRRLRRERIERLADALDSAYLREALAEDVYYDRVCAVTPARWERTFDLEVEDLHNFVADGVVVHNCAPPFRQAEFDILFGEGISKEGSVLDVGVDQGIVKKAGAWYTYDGEQLGQGRENARQFLKEHDDVCAEIYKKVTEALGLVPTDVTGTEGSPGEAPAGPSRK
ncbi:MAG TPA: recombinase RecA [Egibacteraceae bacterium]|jgi:recombination protein RecA|nr:recombinase RecA [Egibacteraceae bacterium]